jgi:large subunit ribosomal protein L30e
MSKILEKSLKDARKEMFEKIEEDAKKEKIPLVNFQGTSVALGRLCGLQFRISTLSFTSIDDANVKSILKDTEAEKTDE